MQDHRKHELLEKLKPFPLFSRYLGPSLGQRITADSPFENRFIRSIYQHSDWIQRHESLLEKARIEEVKNSDDVFSNLKGNDRNYDLKIFDTLVEVRLICWATENGYADLEKLIPQGPRWPDFRMRKDGEIIIAEAKHCRERDFPVDFVEDRLKGLLMEDNCLTEFGISVDTTAKYDNERESILREDELKYRQFIRDELTEESLKTIEISLANDPTKEIKIINGLFVVFRSEIPHDASVSSGLSRGDATERLKQLGRKLTNALEQCKSFIENDPFDEIPTRALVFLAGTEGWQMEWQDMWDALSESSDNVAWDKVEEVRKEASQVIDLPFELIVGKGTPVEYVHFPWTPRQ